MQSLLEIRQQAQAETDTLRKGRVCIAISAAGLDVTVQNSLAEQFVAEATRLGIDVRIIRVGSLGWRENEPVVAIDRPGEPRVYFPKADEDLVRDLMKCLSEGGELPAERMLDSLPFFDGQKRVALRNVGLVDPEQIDDALARGAYQGLEKALSLSPVAVIEKIEHAGLRMRGTSKAVAASWRLCRNAEADSRSIVADACFGFNEYGPYDLLLEGDPHSVLEGILIAACAVGADRAWLCIDPHSTIAMRRAQLALDQLKTIGLVGTSILGSSFSCEIEIRPITRRLPAADETILIAAVEGRQPQAGVRPPEPEVKGLFGKATVVQDVESLAIAANILSRDDETECGAQTIVIQLDGSLKRTGFVEVELGTSLRTIVEKLGGGVRQSALKAIQIGGAGGGWVPATDLDLLLDHESMQKAGCTLSSGFLHAASEDECAVDLAKQAATAAHKGCCGGCTFGREGTRQLVDVLSDMTEGRGNALDIELLLSLCDGMQAASLCANGRNAPEAVLTAIHHFRGEFESHLGTAPCQFHQFAEIVSADGRVSQ